MEPIRSFDDLSVGQEFRFGTMSIPLEDVLDFARRWDSQPFHTDEARARESPFGGLIASGIHTLAAAFGHMIAGQWRADLGQLQPGLRIPNLLTISLDDALGAYRGAGHRQADAQQLFVGNQAASPGLVPGPIAAGPWWLTLSAHTLVTDRCDVSIQIGADSPTSSP